MKYFSYDHHGNGVEYHDTAEEAKNYAQECLDSYTQNDNLDDIDICWGEIKEAVHSNNAVLELKPTNYWTEKKESLLLVLEEMHKIMEKERNSYPRTKQFNNRRVTMAINTLTATGNAGQDAILRYAQNGTAIGEFSLPVKFGYGDKQKTAWLKCVMWGKLAEGYAPYIKRGDLVAVSGEFYIEEWQTEGVFAQNHVYEFHKFKPLKK